MSVEKTLMSERAPNLLRKISDNLSLLNGRKFSLDIDGVIQATYIKALNWASHRLGVVIDRDQLTSYWKLADIAEKYGIAKEESLVFAKSAWNNPEVYSESPPQSGAHSLLEILHQIGYPYILLSSRPLEFSEVTKVWFKNRFPWVFAEDIIVEREKGVSEGVYKSDKICKRDAGLHIDDSIDEAFSIAKNTKAKVLLVPQPWNFDTSITHPNIYRLKHYSDTSGLWQVIRFLASKEAELFLKTS